MMIYSLDHIKITVRVLQKIFEENISPRYNVRFVLDDNYKCVKMYRDLGLTVLQPNEGKF